MAQKTHVFVNNPEISVRYLVDYMPASERVRRTLETTFKYRPIARLVQHKEAKLVVTSHIVNGKAEADAPPENKS